MTDGLKAAATRGGNEQGTTVWSLVAGRLAILEALINDRRIEGELGLDADLKTILLHERPGRPSLGLRIGYPLLLVSAPKGRKEGRAKIGLGVIGLTTCPPSPHASASKSARPWDSRSLHGPSEQGEDRSR